MTKSYKSRIIVMTDRNIVFSTVFVKKKKKVKINVVINISAVLQYILQILCRLSYMRYTQCIYTEIYL